MRKGLADDEEILRTVDIYSVSSSNSFLCNSFFPIRNSHETNSGPQFNRRVLILLK